MSRIKYFLPVLGFTLIISSVAYAQVGLKKVAQSTMNFQLVSVSARASAMGEAFNAIGQGAESVFFNPAGMAEMGNRFDLKFYGTQWIADIDYMAGAIAWNLGSAGTIGFSVLSVDYGTIRGTSLLTASEITLYPIGYKETGNISNVGAYSMGVSYGRVISTQFLIGGNMRFVGQNLGQNQFGSNMRKNNASKLVFDMGVKYFTGVKDFRFGMTIRNFSSNLKREEISEQLPLLFTMGGAIDLLDFIAPNRTNGNAMTLAVDFLHPNNYSERMNFGLEYILLGKLALRGGYQTNQDVASWSLGFGVNQQLGNNLVMFDYSYSNFEIFDGVNRLSVGFSF